jgi:hypothetical protein
LLGRLLKIWPVMGVQVAKTRWVYCSRCGLSKGHNRKRVGAVNRCKCWSVLPLAGSRDLDGLLVGVQLIEVSKRGDDELPKCCLIILAVKPGQVV